MSRGIGYPTYDILDGSDVRRGMDVHHSDPPAPPIAGLLLPEGGGSPARCCLVPPLKLFVNWLSATDEIIGRVVECVCVVREWPPRRRVSASSRRLLAEGLRREAGGREVETLRRSGPPAPCRHVAKDVGGTSMSEG